MRETKSCDSYFCTSFGLNGLARQTEANGPHKVSSHELNIIPRSVHQPFGGRPPKPRRCIDEGFGAELPARDATNEAFQNHLFLDHWTLKSHAMQAPACDVRILVCLAHPVKYVSDHRPARLRARGESTQDPIVIKFF